MKGESVESPRSANDKNRVLILRKAFDVYDVDGSGSIDYSEFKRLIQDLGWPAHEEFIDRAVRVLDQDMSGAIEFSEFQKWTEFAYASRILYRQEMYGLGPRSSSVDGANMEPVVDEAHDGKKALVIRRTSLTTVFEGKEHADQEKPRNGEEENEDEGRHGLLLCTSGSSNTREAGRDAEPSDSFMLRFYQRKSSPHIPFREIKNNCASSFSKAVRGGDDGSEEEYQDSVENDGMDGENIPSTRNIDAPIGEMATMVLSSRRRSRKIHTSRSRGKSVGIVRSQKSNRFDPSCESASGEKGDDDVVLGPRTESKVTVRMRFACGQFDGQESEGSEPSSIDRQCFGGSGSESGEELQPDESLASKEELRLKGDEANGFHQRDEMCDGKDDDGKSYRDKEREDGDADDRNRDTE